MQTGLIKRRDSKLLLISIAAAQLDSPLGRLRARAMAQPTAKRVGAVVEARGDLHWLEWSVPGDVDLDDLDAVKRANPDHGPGSAPTARRRARDGVRAVPRLPLRRRRGLMAPARRLAGVHRRAGVHSRRRRLDRR
jgi:hypothetical protein